VNDFTRLNGHASSGLVEGAVYLRKASTMTFFKAWTAAWAQLNIERGTIRCWEDKRAMLRGDDALESIVLSPAMALSSMKVLVIEAGGAAALGRRVAGLLHGKDSTAPSPSRIFYRHVADLGQTGGGDSSAALTSTPIDARRVWKFGAESTGELARWAEGVRASIACLAAAEKALASRAKVMEGAVSAVDLLRFALRSPPNARLPAAERDLRGSTGGGLASLFSTARRRKQFGHNEEHDGSASRSEPSSFSLCVYLLDGSEVCSLTGAALAAGRPQYEPSLSDACVALANTLGVEADADFSLFLAATPNVRDDNASDGAPDIWATRTWTLLPDIMAAKEAAALADPYGGSYRVGADISHPPFGCAALPSVAVVYKRRAAATFQRAPDASDAAELGSAELAGLPPFDTEALQPGRLDDDVPGLGAGALRLAFLESVHAFTSGLDLVTSSLDEAVHLAALHTFAVRGHAMAGGDALSLDWYRRAITGVLPASAVLRHRETTREGADGLAARLREAHHGLDPSMTPGRARRAYVRACRATPHSGATIFAGHLERWEDGALKAPPSPLPDWVAAATAEGPPAHNKAGRAAEARTRVLLGVCPAGLLLRPLPPRHPPASTYTYGPPSSGNAINGQTSEVEGISTPWWLSPVTSIEARNHR